MMSYLIGGLGLVSILVGGFATIQTKKVEALRSEMVLVRGQLQTCGGRLDAILRDMESDNEVDNLDLTDFDVPAEWMRPGGSTSP